MDLPLLLLLFNIKDRSSPTTSIPRPLAHIWILGGWALDTMSVEIDSWGKEDSRMGGGWEE